MPSTLYRMPSYSQGCSSSRVQEPEEALLQQGTFHQIHIPAEINALM